jgi:hypothetical protein
MDSGTAEAARGREEADHGVARGETWRQHRAELIDGESLQGGKTDG